MKIIIYKIPELFTHNFKKNAPTSCEQLT